jgi:hypothetical protein
VGAPDLHAVGRHGPTIFEVEIEQVFKEGHNLVLILDGEDDFLDAFYHTAHDLPPCRL